MDASSNIVKCVNALSLETPLIHDHKCAVVSVVPPALNRPGDHHKGLIPAPDLGIGVHIDGALWAEDSVYEVFLLLEEANPGLIPEIVDKVGALAALCVSVQRCDVFHG